MPQAARAHSWCQAGSARRREGNEGEHEEKVHPCGGWVGSHIDRRLDRVGNHPRAVADNRSARRGSLRRSVRAAGRRSLVGADCRSVCDRHAVYASGLDWDARESDLRSEVERRPREQGRPWRLKRRVDEQPTRPPSPHQRTTSRPLAELSGSPRSRRGEPSPRGAKPRPRSVKERDLPPDEATGRQGRSGERPS